MDENSYYRKYLKYRTKYLYLKDSQHGGQNGDNRSLYDRLGGIYGIAAVINKFSDDIIKDPRVGVGSPNQQLDEWSRNHQEDRLPGLKWMRTLWVAGLAGGPYNFVATVPETCPFSLEGIHSKFKISPEEFDVVAGILANTLDYFKVPEKEKSEVLAVFSAHKPEVNRGYDISIGKPPAEIECPHMQK